MQSANHQTATPNRRQAGHTQTRRDKLTVMQIILNLEVGGAQEVVHTLVKHLAAQDCRSVVCTFEDGPIRQQIEKLGIPVEILPRRRYSVLLLPLFLGDMVRIWRTLARLIKAYRVDVVQTHLLMSLDFLAPILLYTTRLRAALWTVHSYNFELKASMLPGGPLAAVHKWLLTPKRMLHRAFYRWGSRLISGYVAISEQVGQAILDVIGPARSKVSVISNGVDVARYKRPSDPASQAALRRQLGLDPAARYLIVVGTLKEVKGHRFMIKALASLSARYPDLHLLVVGDGELGPSLQAQSATLGLDGRIHFLGSRRDVPDLLAASDLFVLPSLWEGLSMALLEAMAAGLPIVASEVSGTVQAILPGETGLLVSPGDVQELECALAALLDDPERARAMGQAAQQRAIAKFSAQQQAVKHLALYRRLIDGSTPTRDARSHKTTHA